MAKTDAEKAYAKRYYQENRERLIAQSIAYQAAHPEKVAERKVTYRARKTELQRKYDSDPEARERKRTRERENYRDNPKTRKDTRTAEQRAAARLRWRHGISPEIWQKMWDKQQGCCYLCEQPLPDNTSEVMIDHDHDHCPPNSSCPLCQRGLACKKCNWAIGVVADNPDLLRRIASNLERVMPIIKARIVAAPRQNPLF